MRERERESILDIGFEVCWRRGVRIGSTEKTAKTAGPEVHRWRTQKSKYTCCSGTAAFFFLDHGDSSVADLGRPKISI